MSVKSSVGQAPAMSSFNARREGGFQRNGGNELVASYLTSPATQGFSDPLQAMVMAFMTIACDQKAFPLVPAADLG